MIKFSCSRNSRVKVPSLLTNDVVIVTLVSDIFKLRFVVPTIYQTFRIYSRCRISRCSNINLTRSKFKFFHMQLEERLNRFLANPPLIDTNPLCSDDCSTTTLPPTIRPLPPGYINFTNYCKFTSRISSSNSDAGGTVNPVLSTAPMAIMAVNSSTIRSSRINFLGIVCYGNKCA